MRIAEISKTSWDLLSLGEVMLRFDPGERTLETARQMEVWEGGAEYNVAQGLSRCFGRRTAILTALVASPLGHLVESRISESRVDVGEILWRAEGFHPTGMRTGLNFVERGFGLRPPRGVSDRGWTAASALQEGDFDWRRLLTDEGTRVFHTGGVFASLSEGTRHVAERGMREARATQTVVSYDMNFRESLWAGRGGREAADLVNRGLIAHADIVFGVPGLSAAELATAEPQRIEDAMRKLHAGHSHLTHLVTTVRSVTHTNQHLWGAACLGPQGFSFCAPTQTPVLDRIGGGEGFAAGFLHGLLSGWDEATSFKWGLAHGELVMSTPGDTSMAQLAQVEAIVLGQEGLCRCAVMPSRMGRVWSA